MRRHLRMLAPVLVIAAGVLVAFVIFTSRSEPAAEEPETLPPAVRVIEVSLVDHRFVVASQGTVAPRTEIPLVTEVGGRVVAVSESFDGGGFFARGEVLVEIDPTDYRLALTRAAAEVKQAELNLSLERADAEVARTEWERIEGGDAPPLVGREPQLAQAEAALEAAKAAVATAERNLDRTRLAAPFDGRVRTANVDVGQVVAQGTVAGHIYAIDYAEIELPIATDDLAFVELPMSYRNGTRSDATDTAAIAGAPVELIADLGGRRHAWTGRVVRTGGTIDPTSRRLDVIARIDDPYGRSAERPDRPPLPVGVFVDARIQGRAARGVFVLPRAALRPDDEILVVDGEERLRIRRVDVLRRTREHAVIGEGLEAGARVVVSPMEAPVDGMAVRPQRVASEATADTAGTASAGSR